MEALKLETNPNDLVTSKEVEGTDYTPTLLVVEDDITMKPLLEFIIEEAHPGARVVWMHSEAQAEVALNGVVNGKLKFDMVIVDIYLSSNKTGVDLWRRYRGFGINFILVSAISYHKFCKMVEGDQLRPVFLNKPFDPTEAIETLKSMVSLSQGAQTSI